MTAPRPGNPDICPLCAAKLVHLPSAGLIGGYYFHAAEGCVLTNFKFSDRDVALWNRRVGKPLWAKPRPAPIPRNPSGAEFAVTHPKTKEETRK